MLGECLGCNHKFLTEAEPHLVFPHYSGYHLFCLECAVGYRDIADRQYSKLYDIVLDYTKKEAYNCCENTTSLKGE